MFSFIKELQIDLPDQYLYNHKKVYTDNPAWVFYDLVTNERYGLGQFVDLNQSDFVGTKALEKDDKKRD